MKIKIKRYEATVGSIFKEGMDLPDDRFYFLGVAYDHLRGEILYIYVVKEDDEKNG